MFACIELKSSSNVRCNQWEITILGNSTQFTFQRNRTIVNQKRNLWKFLSVMKSTKTMKRMFRRKTKKKRNNVYFFVGQIKPWLKYCICYVLIEWCVRLVPNTYDLQRITLCRLLSLSLICLCCSVHQKIEIGILWQRKMHFVVVVFIIVIFVVLLPLIDVCT